MGSFQWNHRLQQKMIIINETIGFKKNSIVLGEIKYSSKYLLFFIKITSFKKNLRTLDKIISVKCKVCTFPIYWKLSSFCGNLSTYWKILSFCQSLWFYMKLFVGNYGFNKIYRFLLEPMIPLKTIDVSFAASKHINDQSVISQNHHTF